MIEQVANQGLCEKLKALGVEQKSAFYWLNMVEGWKLYSESVAASYDPLNPISAFTVAELGVALPAMMTWPEKSTGGLWAHYQGREFVQSTTEAAARAKLLIYLIEKGLLDAKFIPVSSVNERMGG